MHTLTLLALLTGGWIQTGGRWTTNYYSLPEGSSAGGADLQWSAWGGTSALSWFTWGTLEQYRTSYGDERILTPTVGLMHRAPWGEIGGRWTLSVASSPTGYAPDGSQYSLWGTLRTSPASFHLTLDRWTSSAYALDDGQVEGTLTLHGSAGRWRMEASLLGGLRWRKLTVETSPSPWPRWRMGDPLTGTSTRTVSAQRVGGVLTLRWTPDLWSTYWVQAFGHRVFGDSLLAFPDPTTQTSDLWVGTSYAYHQLGVSLGARVDLPWRSQIQGWIQADRRVYPFTTVLDPTGGAGDVREDLTTAGGLRLERGWMAHATIFLEASATRNTSTDPSLTFDQLRTGAGLRFFF